MIDLLGELRTHIIMGRYDEAYAPAAALEMRMQAGETMPESSAVEALPMMRDAPTALSFLLAKLNQRLPPMRPRGEERPDGSGVTWSDDGEEE